MQTRPDNPGIRVPPPFIYFGMFLLSLLLQWIIPLNIAAFRTRTSAKLCYVLVAIGSLVCILAIFQFVQARTPVVPVKPVRELQTKGLYSITRNPMYSGLLLGYTGFACCFGNWWTIMLIPVLIGIIHQYVIRREEAYLLRTFGEQYENYKKKVRRWV